MKSLYYEHNCWSLECYIHCSISKLIQSSSEHLMLFCSSNNKQIHAKCDLLLRNPTVRVLYNWISSSCVCVFMLQALESIETRSEEIDGDILPARDIGPTERAESGRGSGGGTRSGRGSGRERGRKTTGCMRGLDTAIRVSNHYSRTSLVRTTERPSNNVRLIRHSY